MNLFEKVNGLETLPNGCKIIAIDHLAGVVLAGNTYSHHDGGIEYVTWEFYRGDLRSTSSGHYYGNDYKGAARDFSVRTERNYKYVERELDAEEPRTARSYSA